jgi:hypothetical protein
MHDAVDRAYSTACVPIIAASHAGPLHVAYPALSTVTEDFVQQIVEVQRTRRASSVQHQQQRASPLLVSTPISSQDTPPALSPSEGDPLPLWATTEMEQEENEDEGETSPLPSHHQTTTTTTMTTTESDNATRAMDHIRAMFDNGQDLLHGSASIAACDPPVAPDSLARVSDDGTVLTDDVVEGAARGIVANLLFRWVMGLRLSITSGDLLVECRAPYRVFSVNEVRRGGAEAEADAGDISQAIQDFVYIYNRSGSGGKSSPLARPRRAGSARGSPHAKRPPAASNANAAVFGALPENVRRAFIAAQELHERSGAGVEVASRTHRNEFITPFVAQFRLWMNMITAFPHVRSAAEEAFGTGALILSTGSATALGGRACARGASPVGPISARISCLIPSD